MTVPTPTTTEFWHALVTGSLLGTDRRDPPEPPPGPLAEVVADAVRPTPSGRMLTAVAACTVARRAGVRPRPPAAPLAPPAADERPLVPPAGSRRWRQVVAVWPILEDEWLDIVEQRGWRLPPDVLVGLLRRHRTDGQRRGQVMRMAGPLGPWLVDHLPEIGQPPPGGRSRPGRPDHAGPRPAIAVSPELHPLLTAEPGAVVGAIAGALATGALGAPHRAVLVNFVARTRPDTLAPLAEALRTVDSPAIGLAHLLADLAATRHEMLAELAP
jgi:hypothetical protein